MDKSLTSWIVATTITCCALAYLVFNFPRSHASTLDAKVSLGKTLFFDTSLSADGKTSCASCHQPDHAYSDARMTSRGVYGRIGTRNTPSLLSLSSEETFFWDGRRQQLSTAVMDPFLHPGELGLANSKSLLDHLQTSTYKAAFASAFGTSNSQSDESANAGDALAAFIRSVPDPVTPFDRYQRTHDQHALSNEALDGLQLFDGKAGCSQCHQMRGDPVRFTDNEFHSTGTGLQNVAADLPELTQRLSHTPKGDIAALGREVDTHADIAALGRFAITHEAGDIGLFRTPSLRYVANTAPYMHDGSVPTLESAVDQEVYWRGLASGKPLSLTVHERADLIVFLRSISMDTHSLIPDAKKPLNAPQEVN